MTSRELRTSGTRGARVRTAVALNPVPVASTLIPVAMLRATKYPSTTAPADEHARRRTNE
jgi:hypothetical protein